MRILLNRNIKQLSELSEPPPDLDDLATFIKSITKSPSDSKEKWMGERCMVDLCELVKRYYYDPLTKGSNSIKKVLPAVLSRSKYLQEKYSQPIYAGKNVTNQRWLIYEKGIIKDPYLLLEPINKEVPDEEIELLFDDEYLKGGAATIAYAKLQFTHISDFEREELKKALLKYCELAH